MRFISKAHRARMRKLFALCMALILTLPVFTVFSSAERTPAFEALSYPPQALTAFDPSMTRRVSSGDDHISNRGFADETGLYLSPLWSCGIDGEDVPVYAAMTYDYETDIGVLHSFACIWVREFGAGLCVTLRSLADTVGEAVILPESLRTECRTDRDTVRFTVHAAGRYTCLINGDSQKDAVTLTVKPYTDEEAEIAAYRAEYGEENVSVFARGVYSPESIDTEGKKVVYFRRGSFVSAPHRYDVRSDADRAAVPPQPNILTVSGQSGSIITGFGTIDCTKVDRDERGLCFVDRCADTTVEGLLFLDPAGWTVTAYGCEGLTLRGIEVIGYRTNSDAINICGCRDVTVSDCFARNGDDCFSVKTTNTAFSSEHIRFENCIAWSTKARCFGITGEVEAPIRDVLFTDSAVIYRGATWDNNRTSSLAVSVETGGACIQDITFQNIEIHHDSGRPINCMVYNKKIGNCTIRGVVFRGITACGAERSLIAAKRGARGIDRLRSFLFRVLSRVFPDSAAVRSLRPTSNEIEVTLEDVTINGTKVNTVNRFRFFRDTGIETIRTDER